MGEEQWRFGDRFFKVNRFAQRVRDMFELFSIVFLDLDIRYFGSSYCKNDVLEFLEHLLLAVSCYNDKCK